MIYSVLYYDAITGNPISFWVHQEAGQMYWCQENKIRYKFLLFSVRELVVAVVAPSSPPRSPLWPTHEVLARGFCPYGNWSKSAVRRFLSPMEDVVGLIIMSSQQTKVWNKMSFSRLFSCRGPRVTERESRRLQVASHVHHRDSPWSSLSPGANIVTLTPYHTVSRLPGHVTAFSHHGVTFPRLALCIGKPLWNLVRNPYCQWPWPSRFDCP